MIQIPFRKNAICRPVGDHTGEEHDESLRVRSATDTDVKRLTGSGKC
jgi:hypothetical protein